MTTIAYDGKSIAADGQRTWGSEIRGMDFQKLRRVGPYIYAFTGLTPMMDVMIDWHRGGADPGGLPKGVDHKDEPWTLVVLDAKGIGKYTSGCPYYEAFEAPIAFGAGGDYAIGAMLAGADARRAIEIVSSLCYHTGGSIQVLEKPAPLAEAAE